MDTVVQILIVVGLAVIFVVAYILNKRTKVDGKQTESIRCDGCNNKLCTRRDKEYCEEKQNEE